jgi:aldehyde:ferredoxin oxidoreductase
MARIFNLREGLGRKDDVLPIRMNSYHQAGKQNEEPVDPEDLQESITTFYGMMGWDPDTGKPTDGTLAELDIEWAREYVK